MKNFIAKILVLCGAFIVLGSIGGVDFDLMTFGQCILNIMGGLGVIIIGVFIMYQGRY